MDTLREGWGWSDQPSRINKRRNIRFKQNHSIKSLDDVIYWGVVKTKPTYISFKTAPDRLVQQCDEGRRRSTEDLFLICKNYGVETTLEEIDDYLTVLSTNTSTVVSTFNNPILRGYCPVVQRVVHRANVLYSIEGGWYKITKAKFKDIINNVRNRNNTSSG